MRKEEMKYYIKIREIFKVLGEEAGYREATRMYYRYVKDVNNKDSMEVKLNGYKFVKHLLGKKHKKGLRKWISSIDSLGLAEGLVEREGITDSEEHEGRAGKYIVIWYVRIDGGIGLVADHRNTLEEVRKDLKIEIEELGASMIENTYLIDVENLRIIDFVICIDKEEEQIEVRFIE